MKMRYMILLSLCSSLCEAQSIPAFHGRSFAGDEVTFPHDLDRRIGILIVGFSKKSGENAKIWGAAIAHQFETDSQVVYYEMPVLEGVPSLIRGLVLRSMRHGMSAAEQSHFAPVLQDEDKWKEAVHFNSPDDAYVLVLNRVGVVKWRTQGAMTASSRDSLASAVGALR